MVPDRAVNKPSPNTGYSGRRIAAAEPERDRDHLFVAILCKVFNCNAIYPSDPLIVILFHSVQLMPEKGSAMFLPVTDCQNQTNMEDKVEIVFIL